MNQRVQPLNNNNNPEVKKQNNFPIQNTQNNQNKNVYILTPGQSIREELNNPYKEPEEEKETPGRYFIPTQDSVCADLKNNPYGPKKWILLMDPLIIISRAQCLSLMKKL